MGARAAESALATAADEGASAAARVVTITATDYASFAGAMVSLAAGREAWFEVELAAADYLLVCFVTAPDGRSHVAHGMVQQIRVGA